MKSVRAAISRSTSGRSTRGKRAFTSARSLTRLVGLIELIEWRYDQVVFTVHLFHASAWIGRQIRCHRSIGLIEFAARARRLFPQPIVNVPESDKWWDVLRSTPSR